MADKTLREFSAPSAANIPTGPAGNVGDANFEIKTGLITMVQASPFCGKANEDASAHLQQFLEICNTFKMKDVTPDAVRLRLFPFSLLGRARQWFYANPEAESKESIPEAWERLQEYILACPHHGMDDWLIIQNFYNGLTPSARDHLDAAAGGAFFSLTVSKAKDLIEKMVSNQGWNEERLQPRQRGMHSVKEVDMLAAKIDLLMKKMDEQANGEVKALDAHMTCEVCGNTGHSGNDCPETREDAMFMGNNNNNGYRPQGGQSWGPPRPNYQGGNSGNFSGFNSGYNQPSLKDLVLGQAKVNDNISKKLATTDRTLESIHTKIEGVSSALKNQLSFNKMIETQLAQLAAAVPTAESGKIPGQPETPLENVNAPTVDEQFTRFVEVIQKLHINVPLLDAIQVPTYARYLKDLISNKRPLPTTEIVKLTEECSAAILNRLPEKKKDPGCPTITCSIGTQNFDHALCDLGASVSVMPKDVFDKLNCTTLSPTTMQLQLADSTVCYPAGIAEDIPVKIRDCFIPVDFVVLDMDVGKSTPLILGHPFLSTADARIDVGAGEIRFHINGKEEKFDFRPRKEQCNMIRIKYGPNPSNIKEVEVTPPKKDSLITFMKNFLEKEKVAQQQLMKARGQRSHIKQQPPKSTRQQPLRSAKKQAVKPAKPQPPNPEKPPAATKTKKVWRVKQEASSVSSSPGPDNASSS
ncbi:hypothetical protein QOZ80_9BG0705840 [Eleusine coracana subsp. coracana]|nr:hypothetical protein QOZ80_9BG0705840 [Eleusine coracana subsp. coracana]